MHAIAATGAGFLVAVLWFDLMFDVQTRRHAGETLPVDVLISIAGYYRRVTTQARPMNQLIPAVMLVTVVSIVIEIVKGGDDLWAGWISLVLATSGIGLAMARTVRNAVRLGGSKEPIKVRTDLARSIYRDHLYCLAAMLATVVLQLTAVAG